jgi:hypothetical protein
VFAARSCLWGGLALCSGAVTVTLGRGELGVVCEAAVPLKPHNNEVDRIATAEGATRLDDILITRTPKSGAVTCIFHARNKAFGRDEHSPQCSDLAFPQKEDQHHWKCPMYPANFRVDPF